jgi:hypothetical protein
MYYSAWSKKIVRERKNYEEGDKEDRELTNEKITNKDRKQREESKISHMVKK